METKLAGDNPVFSLPGLYQKGYLYNTVEAIDRKIRKIGSVSEIYL
jgi:hypothetical protein